MLSDMGGEKPGQGLKARPGVPDRGVKLRLRGIDAPAPDRVRTTPHGIW